jgi:hypothetical protein
MRITLPFGLQTYEDGEFHAVHAPGSGVVTGSTVPALFGFSRWTGRYALAAHIAGKVPLPSGDNPLSARGRDLEVVTASKLRAKGYQLWRPAAGMYARHPTIPNFLASPDGVVRKKDRRQDGFGLQEGKVVARSVFAKSWDEGPPEEVHLQSQSQFACCPDATWGLITALVIGDFQLDLHVYQTERNEKAIKLIEAAVQTLLDLLARGEMPEPDTHATAAAVLQALHPLDEAREISLVGEDYVEAVRHADLWRQSATARLKADKDEKACKAWFLAKAKGAGRVHIGNDRMVEIKEQYRAGYTVDPKTFQTVKLKETR